MPDPKERILLISVSGIGNTILQSPMINRMLSDDRFDIDILFGTKTLASIFLNDTRIRNMYTIPRSMAGKIKLVLGLRKNRYDYSVACFPSNRVEFNLLPFLINAQNRVIHSYAVGNMTTLSFLSNRKIEPDLKLHDVDQNLNLLGVFGINPANVERKLTFALTEQHRAFASLFLEKNRIDKESIVGIHAGSKLIGAYKRWPTDKFADLINRLNEHKYSCLLFSGPEDREVTDEILSKLRNKHMTVIVEERNINHVGALIAQCRVFINTDSGLGHIAPALNVPTLTIIGPAQASRTAPYGENGHYVSLHLECSPCLKYPFQATHSRIRCPYDFKCLKDLDVETVFSKTMSYLT